MYFNLISILFKYINTLNWIEQQAQCLFMFSPDVCLIMFKSQNKLHQWIHELKGTNYHDIDDYIKIILCSKKIYRCLGQRKRSLKPNWIFIQNLYLIKNFLSGNLHPWPSLRRKLAVEDDDVALVAGCSAHALMLTQNGGYVFWSMSVNGAL